MSLYDYKESLKIECENYGFYSLIMASMRQADDKNLYKLKTCFPDIYNELKQRYNAPGGLLENDI